MGLHKSSSKTRNICYKFYTNICNIYGNNEVSYRTVSKWEHKFQNGHESINDAFKSCTKRSILLTGYSSIHKAKLIIDKDAKLSLTGIHIAGISKGSTR
jgi:hypothetical protein